MKKALIIIIIILLLSLIGVVSYKYVNDKNNDNNSGGNNNTITVDLTVFSQALDAKATKSEEMNEDSNLIKYVYGDYVVEVVSDTGGADSNEIIILKNGKELYHNTDVKQFILADGTTVKNDIETKAIIVNGILYFLSYGSPSCREKSEDQVMYNFDLNSIDLTKSDITANIIKTYYLKVEGSVPSCESIVDVNTNITSQSYSGEEDFNKVKSQLEKRKYSIDIGDASSDPDYATLYVSGKKVIFDFYYKDMDDDIKNTQYEISNIPNPVSVYFDDGLGGEDSYPVEFYVMDNSGNIYVVNMTLKYYDNSETKIYMVK